MLIFITRNVNKFFEYLEFKDTSYEKHQMLNYSMTFLFKNLFHNHPVLFSRMFRNRFPGYVRMEHFWFIQRPIEFLNFPMTLVIFCLFLT